MRPLPAHTSSLSVLLSLFVCSLSASRLVALPVHVCALMFLLCSRPSFLLSCSSPCLGVCMALAMRMLPTWNLVSPSKFKLKQALLAPPGFGQWHPKPGCWCYKYPNDLLVAAHHQVPITHHSLGKRKEHPGLTSPSTWDQVVKRALQKGGRTNNICMRYALPSWQCSTKKCPEKNIKKHNTPWLAVAASFQPPVCQVRSALKKDEFTIVLQYCWILLFIVDTIVYRN